MKRHYTESIREGFFDLIVDETVEIWNSLDRSAAMIATGNWGAHYSNVVSKYRMSCRFAIMRILFEKATDLPYVQINEESLMNGFTVSGIGDFPDISITHARDMSQEELARYKQLLLQRVNDNNPDYYTEAEKLIERALLLPIDGTKCSLSRNEIIRLGHMVDFTLDDMQFLLLRVLGDNEAGFLYSSSMDVIDMYGFVARATLDVVEKLKAWYVSKAVKIQKVSYEDKPIYCTQDIANSLEQTFDGMRIKEFEDWLLKQAPFLDLKSKTARKVYLNLAMYAYIRTCKMHSSMSDIIGSDFYRDMEFIANIREYHEYTVSLFYRDSKVDEQKCRDVAEVLIFENAEYAGNFHSHTTNSELLYHGPYVENGKITSRGKLNKGSKQRIVDILMDNAVPTKSDILYLLWYVANCEWIGNIKTSEDKEIFLDDFLAATSCLLNAALLPDFYPPNVLEETMMISIVQGKDTRSPAVVYESICSFFTDKGKVKKPKGAKKKSPEKQKEIAEWFYAHETEYPTKAACKEACANCYNIGVKSVEGYCRKYPKE